MANDIQHLADVVERIAKLEAEVQSLQAIAELSQTVVHLQGQLIQTMTDKLAAAGYIEGKTLRLVH